MVGTLGHVTVSYAVDDFLDCEMTDTEMSSDDARSWISVVPFSNESDLICCEKAPAIMATVRNGVLDVAKARDPFEVIRPCVSRIAVFVIYLWKVVRVGHESFCHQPMNNHCSPIFSQSGSEIATIIRPCFQQLASQSAQIVTDPNPAIKAAHSAKVADCITSKAYDWAPNFRYRAMGHGSLLSSCGQGLAGRLGAQARPPMLGATARQVQRSRDAWWWR